MSSDEGDTSASQFEPSKSYYSTSDTIVQPDPSKAAMTHTYYSNTEMDGEMITIQQSETVTEFEGINSVYIKIEADASPEALTDENDSLCGTNSNCDVKSEEPWDTSESSTSSSNSGDENIFSKFSSQKTTNKEKNNTNIGEELFCCEFCSYETSEKTSLLRHILIHTDESGKLPIVKNQINGKRHISSNDKVEVLPFEKSSNDDTEQVSVNISRKLFSCEHCPYETNKRYDLNKHAITHKGEKPFSCSLCPFKTKHKYYLKAHTRTHTGEKPFSCQHCSFTANQGSHLTKHNITKHPLLHKEEIFTCKYCPFKSCNRLRFIGHVSTHTGEKLYSCEHCSYQTNDKSRFSRHIPVHTGEKAHSCHLCPYKTNQKINLTTHIKTHTGEKPLTCHLCSFKTNRKRNLDNHILTHKGRGYKRKMATMLK